MVFSYKEISMYYDTSGIADTSKTTLLFLHGFGNTSDEWRSVVSILGSDYQSVLIDLPGFGRSDTPDDSQYYSQDFLAELILRFIAALKLTNVVLIGYSMGGRLALSIAVNNPKAIVGYIFESTSPGIANEQERHARKQADNELCEFIRNNSIETFVDYWMNIPLFKSLKYLPESTYSEVKQSKLQNRKNGLIYSLQGFGAGAMRPLHRDLRTIEAPVLLITGELDSKYSQINRSIDEHFMRSNHVIVKDTGHNVHLENPKEFYKLLDMFLKSL